MKKVSIILLACLVAAIVMPTTATAGRPDSRFRMGLNVNVALPMGTMGDFSTFDNFAIYSHQNADGNVPQEGGFGVGFGIDLKASYRLDDSPLSVYGKLGVIVNNLMSDATDSTTAFLKRTSWGQVIASEKIDHPSMFTIPLMVGARYDLNIAGNFGLFAEAGVGVALRTMSKSAVKFYDFGVYVIDPDRGDYLTSYEEVYKAKMTASFAFELGAGVNLTRWLSAGVYYTYLGAADIKYSVIKNYTYETVASRTISSDYTAGHLKNQQLALRLGFTF